MGSVLRFATFLAPNLLPVYQFLADRVAGRLCRPVELVVGTSLDQFEQGEVDRGGVAGTGSTLRLAGVHPELSPGV